jgi:hypothetical protein
MSDRLYVDPVTHSAREERALFALGKKLNKSVGQLYRFGIITYCRSRAEDGNLPDEVLEDFNKIMQRDPEYLDRLKQDRIAGDLCKTEILTQEKTPEVMIPIYNKITRQNETIPETMFHPKLHERI